MRKSEDLDFYCDFGNLSDHYLAGDRLDPLYPDKDEHRRTVDWLLKEKQRNKHIGASAATLDGLNLSPVDTAKMLMARLKEADMQGLAKSLQSALDALDPVLLRLPAYEREGPANTPPAGRRPRPQGQPSGG